MHTTFFLFFAKHSSRENEITNWRAQLGQGIRTGGGSVVPITGPGGLQQHHHHQQHHHTVDRRSNGSLRVSTWTSWPEIPACFTTRCVVVVLFLYKHVSFVLFKFMYIFYVKFTELLYSFLGETSSNNLLAFFFRLCYMSVWLPILS